MGVGSGLTGTSQASGPWVGTRMSTGMATANSNFCRARHLGIR
jgi:hypothetical protein